MNKRVASKIEEFFGHYPLRDFKKGQILIYAGDEPSGIFHLVRGEVRQYDITSSGDELVVNIFRPPAYFPMSWAINRTRNRYFFEAATDVSLHIAPAKETIRFLKTNSDVMFDLLSRLYSGTDGLLGRIIQLMSGTARSRTIYELVLVCKRMGKRLSNVYKISLPESEVASCAGLSRETVSRELHRLEQEGHLKVGRKNIIIKNLKALEK